MHFYLAPSPKRKQPERMLPPVDGSHGKVPLVFAQRVEAGIELVSRGNQARGQRCCSLPSVCVDLLRSPFGSAGILLDHLTELSTFVLAETRWVVERRVIEHFEPASKAKLGRDFVALQWRPEYRAAELLPALFAFGRLL